MIVPPRTRSAWSLLFTLRGSIIPVIWKRVASMMLLALAIVLIDRLVLRIGLALSTVPLTLMGLTLAIFLGFRNGAAYDRWWEARKLWGALVIVLRNLARQGLTFPNTMDAVEQRRQVYRLIAFAHALSHLLRGTPASADLAHWLPEAEARTAAAARNAPNVLLKNIGRHHARLLGQGQIDTIELTAFDAQLSRLSDVLGGCERIQSAPIPFAYLLLLHRTVYIYCLLLPICLVGGIGWFAPWVVGVLAYTFFGLDALGDQIENPFERHANGLPLDALCRTIEINLCELLGDTELPEPLPVVNDVLY